MASRKRTAGGYSRRFFWLAAFIVLAILAYTGGWYYAADRLETRTASIIEGLNGERTRAACEEPTARGYPFRIGLFCRSVSYEDDTVSLTAGAFRSAAQIYRPSHTVGELDGPAHLALPHLPPLRVDWESLRLSAHLTSALPQRIDSQATALAFARDGAADSALAALDDLQLHTRRNGADLDVALSFAGLALTPQAAGGARLPPFDGTLRATMSDGVALLAARNASLRGRSGRLDRLALSVTEGAAGMTLSGPLSVDADGLIDADLELTLTAPRAIAELAGAVFPAQRRRIRAAMSAIAGMGDAPRLPVTIRKSRVSLAFLPLGEIPPLD